MSVRLLSACLVVAAGAACGSSIAGPGEAAINQIELSTGLRADLGWSVDQVFLSEEGGCAALDLITEDGVEVGVNLASLEAHPIGDLFPDGLPPDWVAVVDTDGWVTVETGPDGYAYAHRTGFFAFGPDCRPELVEDAVAPGDGFVDSTAGPSTIVLTFPGQVTPQESTAAALVINDRLSEIGLGGVKTHSDPERITVEVPAGWDGEAVASALGLPGELSMRPVLDVAAYDGASALTMGDDPVAEAWLLDRDGVTVYHLGPARVVGSDIGDAVAELSVLRDAWVVALDLTAAGADRFQEVTGELAGFPMGDVRRQIAVVLDGVVWSAPTIAATVDPAVGITGGLVVHFGDEQAEATALAVALRTSTLPVVFANVAVEPS